MTLVIATDEAGYGPKLGPLVIVASAWQEKGGSLLSLTSASAPEKAPDPFLAFGGEICARRTRNGSLLPIGDSKKLFQRSSSNALESLEKPILAWLADLNLHPFPANLRELIELVAADDCRYLLRKPWFSDLSSPLPEKQASHGETEFESLSDEGSVRLAGLRARILDAEEFNQRADECGNKATLLSEATVELVRDLLNDLDQPAKSSSTPTFVFSDRHGGRQRYAGVLQQFFPDCIPLPVDESKQCSRYRLDSANHQIDWRFTVKGDSFAPVAFSSMMAKYLRERLMQHFNQYWLMHHGDGLRPTAGYPVDAEHFCRNIASTALRLGIKAGQYVRSR